MILILELVIHRVICQATMELVVGQPVGEAMQNMITLKARSNGIYKILRKVKGVQRSQGEIQALKIEAHMDTKKTLVLYFHPVKSP